MIIEFGKYGALKKTQLNSLTVHCNLKNLGKPWFTENNVISKMAATIVVVLPVPISNI